MRRWILAFAIALRDAADDSHAAPNEEIRQLRELLKQAQARLAGDQQAVERLQEGLKAKAKPELQQQLEAAQLQLTLDREEVADASQKLIWSGGDAVAILERMLDQHEASHSAPFNLPSEEPFVESWTVFSHVRAWQTLQPKQQRIEAAAREADNTAAALTRTRQELQQRVDRERSKVVSPATAGLMRRRRWRPCTNCRRTSPTWSITENGSSICRSWEMSTGSGWRR